MPRARRIATEILASGWMSEVASGRMQVVIDAEVIQEILHRYGSLGRFEDAVDMARDLMTLVPQILPVTAADMQIAVSIFQQYSPQGLKARDAIHAAVMQTHGHCFVLQRCAGRAPFVRRFAHEREFNTFL